MTSYGAGLPGMIDATVGGRFRLGEAIGSGSYSTVYGAVDEQTATPVAVKVLRGGDDKLMAEAALLSTVRHPNVVGYYASGRETTGPLANRVWVAMELADRTLADLLDSTGGKLPWEMLRPIVVDALRGLAYLHSQDPVVLHRDIKPDNILDFGGRWALGDLGLATSESKSAQGAQAYRAPELKPGVAPSVATDMWALGHLIERSLGTSPSTEKVGSAETAKLLRSLKYKSPSARPESAVLVLEDLAPTGSRTHRLGTGAAVVEAGPDEPTGEQHALASLPATAKRSGVTKKWLAVAAGLAVVAAGVAVARPGGAGKRNDLIAKGNDTTTSTSFAAVATMNPSEVMGKRQTNPDTEASSKTVDTGLHGDLVGPPGFNSTPPTTGKVVPPTPPVTSGPGAKLDAFQNASNRIAFGGDFDGKPGLYTMMKTDGSDRQPVAYGIIGSPAWSPDRKQIAFVQRATWESPGYLVVVNEEGVSKKPLGESAGQVYPPSWSPDSKSVIVATGIGTLKVNVDTKETAQFAPSATCQPYYTAWSSTDRMAFVAQEKVGGNCGDWFVYTSRSDGSQATKISQPNSATHPDWSADGTRIAYSSRELRDSDPGADIFVVNADGSNPTRVATEGDSELRSPKWSGSLILYTRREGDAPMELYQVLAAANSTGHRVGVGFDGDW